MLFRSIVSVIGGMLLAAGSVHASTTFTSEAAFLAALPGGSKTHNFDSLAHGTSVTNQFSGVAFSNAEIYDEVSNPSGGATHTPPNVLLNSVTFSPISFVFDVPVDGVGFYNTSLQDTEQVTFFDGGANILFQGVLPQSPVNFLGFVSDTPIASGEVVGIAPQTQGTIFIDTFSFGTIPEPSTALLLASGLVALAAGRRRMAL